MVAGIARLSARTTQVVNAFVLLGFTFLDGLVTVWKEHRFQAVVNAHGLILFSLSCLCLVVASFLALWPLSVLGLCLNLAALLSFCFGRNGVVAFYPALAGLGLAAGMLVLVPGMDEQLRALAAHGSSWLLARLGVQADVVMRGAPFQIVLIVEKGAGVFDVASECNGFGILLSSVVLTLVLAIRMRCRWLVTAGLLVLALVSGALFNTLRIVVIILATLQTDVSYNLIHEGLGTAVYIVALGAMYGIVAASRPHLAGPGLTSRR